MTKSMGENPITVTFFKRVGGNISAFMTRSIQGDFPEDIVNTFKTWTEEYFRKYNRKYQIRDVESGGRDDIAELGNDLVSSARKMGEAAEKFASVPRGKKWWGS
ncbi:MAG: hypothetical protein HND47_00965 [Chloroflexi bacterium]|nr:hypothetical protein [Chloroflexota bacterium]